jgi:hypothetical protein
MNLLPTELQRIIGKYVHRSEYENVTLELQYQVQPVRNILDRNPSPNNTVLLMHYKRYPTIDYGWTLEYDKDFCTRMTSMSPEETNAFLSNRLNPSIHQE